MIASARSLLYYQGMGDKRYIVKPAYFSGQQGRVKLYLIYDTESPVFEGHTMMPSWVLRDSYGALQRFWRGRAGDDDIRLAPARVLSSDEAVKYGGQAIDV